MGNNQLGLIGLGVMGQNFVLNFGNKGIKMSVFNKTESVTKNFISTKVQGQPIEGFYDLKSFVESLERPRKIIMLIKAGSPVDSLISQLLPFLEKGDILIDSGNSYFKDTERREGELRNKDLFYVGMGISGGERGALEGPSLMPGGDKEVYKLLGPLLLKVAAPDPSPCVSYMGNRSAGHYVKMVHNGIEYSDMQLISEVYFYLKKSGFQNNEIKEIFDYFQKTELNSYLIEITAQILAKKDPETNNDMIDMILDTAEGKGTGSWTVQEAASIGAVIPSIGAALDARFISSFRDERSRMSAVFNENDLSALKKMNKESIREFLKGALLVGKVLSYAQGLDMLARASNLYEYDLNLSSITKVWRGGCIIRSELLDKMTESFENNTTNYIPNLIEFPFFSDIISNHVSKLREFVVLSAQSALPVPAFYSCLWYYDSVRSKSLPANMIQAQRDFFGAHTYKRIDKEGTFHTEWE